MARTKQVSAAQLKVGIMVTIALLLLAALILQQSWGVAWFTPVAKAITYLPDVGGLKPGAPVWLAGIEVGKVRKVAIIPPEVYAGNEPIFRQIAELKRQIDSVDPKMPNAKQIVSDLTDRLRDLKVELRFVEVQLDIRRQYLNRIGRDSEVSIESRGLIGDSYIEISAGTLGVPPIKRDDFYVIEGVRTTGFREIMTGANDVIANFGVLSEQFKNIALKINPDRVGTGLEQTMKDVQTTLRQANSTFLRASMLLEDMRKGDGTFGRFVSDPTLYERMTTALEKFNGIADNVQNGTGTLSKLINNPDLFDSANDTLKKAQQVIDRMDQGEGTLGKLSRDDALYESSRQAVEKFASFVDQIDKGQGTIGKLLKDPSLYNNLDQSTSEITKLIYDLRQDPKKYLTIRFRVF
jgi:phospholipid/cholesterol/gamma-HCH transport system substrate-binding protein